MKDIKKTIKKQRDFFSTNKTKDIKFRIESLKNFKNAIIKNEPLIYKALQKDLHKSKFEAFTSEIAIVIEEINLAIHKLKKWSKPKRVKTPFVLFKSKSYIYKEPYGVSLIIGTWNFPFQLSVNPLVAAIAAGNCAIIKPSEVAPHTSKIIKKIINKVFKPEFCTVIEGGVKETTVLLKERFDIIFYTGSTQVAKIIMEAAAKNLTPIVLELGGKSPCIVDKNINLKVTAKRIIWGKFYNSGQVCIAPDYLYVHKDIKKALLNEMQLMINEFYTKNPEQSNDYGRIINKKHFERLKKLIKKENIVTGGTYNKKGFYIEPTIIDNIGWKDPIMQEEIFGPLCPVLEYTDISEVIKIIKEKEKPLALYLFTEDKNLEKQILSEISFGGGAVNTTIMHSVNLNLPFGGIGSSGMGSYHGKTGFDIFSHSKSVLKKSTLVESDIIYPPYKNWKLKIIKKFF